ncbi:DNA helicase IV [Pseudoalteromonas citrea]|uniref:DNA 3'-5' helicase n=1 Tax=Pseudoalteromonas citrea TaxID=43655 RepID=A0A5S3XU27_9GAMM|nr:UvrD-helicase domain-containing protein [Pseudoalteromonas citrea]TMP43413.1 DNA helicase IV [Pseudoalteromonas citrea]TMP62188.1 DNA helicase IV [Pseudoalteromonas citrea]
MLFITPLIFKYTAPYLSVGIHDDGIVLHNRHGKPELLLWKQINQPPKLDRKVVFSYLTISHTHGQLSQPIKVENKLEFTLRLQRLWVLHHQKALMERILKLERLLKERYLSNGLMSMLMSALTPYCDKWLSWDIRCELSAELAQAIATLKEVTQWNTSDVAEFQESYVSYKLREHEAFFDTVEKLPLTAAQRRACVIQDERQLLLAGAGTGKTSVMIAKAQYLAYTRQAYTKHILMLAYGNEAAREMVQRASQYPTFPKCMTFHKLGLKIIESVEGVAPKISTLAQNEVEKRTFVKETILLFCQEEQYRLSFARYAECSGKDLQSIRQYLEGSKGSRLLKTITGALAHLKCARAMNSLSRVETHFSDALLCIRPILAEYSLYLSNERAIDFEDMVLKSIKYVQEKKFISPWTHFLVDEFQDISPIRAKLLKALITQSERHHLFCVGDDWQSIYRFSGADIAYTTDFTNFFGKGTVTQLDTTFRYHQALLDVSSRFICANPSQIMKRISAHSTDDIAPLVYVEGSDDEQSLLIALSQLNARADKVCSVLILARYHKLLPDKSHLSKLQQQFERLELRTMTFHGSKGKEADYSILLGLHAGAGGVPAQEGEGTLLNALLPEQGHFPHAEERRLFYVALTRAKRQVYLIKPKANPSEFLLELDN